MVMMILILLTKLLGEVKSRAYPEPQHTYPMPSHEFSEFQRLIELKGA